MSVEIKHTCETCLEVYESSIKDMVFILDCPHCGNDACDNCIYKLGMHFTCYEENQEEAGDE